MREIELQSCPFCGLDSAQVEPLGEEADCGLSTVVCTECGGTGPQGTNPVLAVHLWNLAPRHKASMTISGASLMEVFTQFAAMIFNVSGGKK